MLPDKLEIEPSEKLHLWPEGETVKTADLRAITDAHAEAQLRDLTRWSYILRDPTGAICCWGRGTRKECEDYAIEHAEVCALEAWPESRAWPADEWRFVIWPPSGRADRGRG
jgi:hypothetical protein